MIHDSIASVAVIDAGMSNRRHAQEKEIESRHHHENGRAVGKSILRLQVFRKVSLLLRCKAQGRIRSAQRAEEMPKGIIAMQDVVRLEDSPGGKKNHFVIHFGKMHMHLKSDDQAVKNKWFSALKTLWDFYRKENPAGGQEENLQIHQETMSECNSPIRSNDTESLSHYKTKKINPVFLLEIAAFQQGRIGSFRIKRKQI